MAIRFLLFQFAVVITGHAKSKSISLDDRIPHLAVCEPLPTADCRTLIARMLKCQTMIFDDPGFSRQQYVENLSVHGQILAKYQSECEGASDDRLTNDAFQLPWD